MKKIKIESLGITKLTAQKIYDTKKVNFGDYAEKMSQKKGGFNYGGVTNPKEYLDEGMGYGQYYHEDTKKKKINLGNYAEQASKGKDAKLFASMEDLLDQKRKETKEAKVSFERGPNWRL
jgi:hypothetical protein